jgi:hypothetical protein
MQGNASTKRSVGQPGPGGTAHIIVGATAKIIHACLPH